MPTVTIRETYDLSTKPGKMTLIGIHTPTKNIIQRLYPGFCEQYKMCKILHQNVRVASASRLPVDPLNVGYNAEGLVSPEDMFNPILYKAVSNQTLSNLEYRIRGLKHGSQLASGGLSIQGESADASNENVTLLTDEFDVYYSILSNTRGWKVAHPQAGLQLRKLRPLVYEKWYNEGINRNVGEDTEADASSRFPIDASYMDDGTAVNHIANYHVEAMRGRAHRMPAFNTKYLTAVADGSGSADGSSQYNGMSDGQPVNAMREMPVLPCIYTGLILVPPSRSTRLYYRMVVETVVSFFGVQTMDEITTLANLANRTRFPVYWNDYRTTSKDSDMRVEENTVTLSEGAEVSKRMES